MWETFKLRSGYYLPGMRYLLINPEFSPTIFTKEHHGYPIILCHCQLFFVSIERVGLTLSIASDSGATSSLV